MNSFRYNSKKFFKRSIAVLSAAFIAMSGYHIDSYAEGDKLEWPSDFSGEINKEYGDDTTFIITASINSESIEGDISYSTNDNGGVATVESTTGEVTLLKCGEAVITAKIDGQSTISPISYTIKYSKKSLSFDWNGQKDYGPNDETPKPSIANLDGRVVGDNESDINISVKYYLGNTEQQEPLTTAGEYVAKAELTGSKSDFYQIPENKKEYSFKITAGKATVDPAPVAASGLVYSGSAQALLSSAGTATGGSMKYRLGENGEWTDAIPQATNAGDYEVYYKAVGDNTHSDSDVGGPISVSIAKIDLSKCDVTIDHTVFVYDGSEQGPEVSVSYKDTPVPEAVYKVEGDSGKSAKSYKLKLSSNDSTNCTGSKSISWKIVPKDSKMGSDGEITTYLTLGSDVPSGTKISSVSSDNGLSGLTASEKNLVEDEDYEINYFVTLEKLDSSTEGAKKVSAEGATGAAYFKVSCTKEIIIDGESQGITSSKVPSGLSVTMPISSLFPAVQSGYTRKYAILGIDNNEKEALSTSSSSNITATVKSKYMPTFAIAYQDTSNTTYKVTFSMGGHGTAPAAQTIAKGGKVSKPTDPTETGYTFGGWYTDSACTKAYDFNSEVTANLTLYAKWTKVISAEEAAKAAAASANVPKTGDELPLELMLLVLVAGVSFIAMGLKFRTEVRKNDDQ
ncbi:InlB B-repeat-containing protein [Butyrivibrio sp. MC2013]|uniref:InlB B-repeat-containing protein n=1 Tax=Butyrivibrio sp. MC2013 TaxID=1280686 RepID=UPI000420EB85|nr:InlB B-repeat-containing protein [Butyrivibrio sp. MC2013]